MKVLKEIETTKGVLKYRAPNVLEIYDLIDASGLNDLKPVEEQTEEEKKKPFTVVVMKRNLIKHMGFLIDYSGIEGAQSYEDILDDVDSMIDALGTISEELALKVLEIFKKKIL